MRGARNAHCALGSHETVGEFPPHASYAAWRYPVVRNIALTWRRKRAREGGADPGEDAEYVASRPAADEVRRDLEDLAGVLGALLERQREVLLMRFVDGMSLAEVAVALEIPVGTVKSRLHNALRTLRDDERMRRYFES